MTHNPYFLLMYTGAPDYLERRVPHRKAHLELATEFAKRGQLLLGGAFEEPADGAVLAFQALDASVVEEFVKRDPYIAAGVIVGWKIRKWKVVAGSACSNPILPSSL